MNGRGSERGSQRLRRFASGWSAIAVLLVATASLRGEVEHVNTTDLVARFDAHWPASLRRGYQPIFVQVGNRGIQTRQVTIQVRGTYWKNRPFEVFDRVECAPGETIERELVIPVPWDSSVRVSIGDGTESSASGMKVGIGEPDDRPAIAVFSPNSDSARLRLDEALLHVGYGAFRSAAALEFSRLPRRMASYSSLDLVAIDLAEQPPDLDSLAALLAWARLGGVVMFTGRDPEEIATLLPSCAPYLDRARSYGSGAEFTTFPCGFGTIAIDSWDTADTEREGRMNAAAIPIGSKRIAYDRDHPHNVTSQRDDWLRNLTGRAIPRFAPERIPDLHAPVDATPGRGVLVGILFVFTMLVGPFSFFLARRRQAPILAFAYAPAFALLGSIAILAASVASNGLGVKSTSLTFTYLDQRVFRANVTEMRVIFSGLSRSFRLDGRFGLCIPDHDPSLFRRQNWFPTRRADNDEVTRVLDLSEALDHSGGFAPPRRLARQLLIVDEPARARIDLRFESRVGGESNDAPLVVSNALGVGIEVLFVRLAESDVRTLAADAPAVAPGATVTLAKHVPPAEWGLGALLGARDRDPEARSIPSRGVEIPPPDLVAEWLEASGRELRIGEYLAIVDAPVVSPDGGLDLERVAERHVLVGAFELPVAGGPK